VVFVGACFSPLCQIAGTHSNCVDLPPVSTCNEIQVLPGIQGAWKGQPRPLETQRRDLLSAL